MIKDNFSLGVNKLITQAGKQVSISYFTTTTGSVWDDDAVYTQSGTTLNVSGIVLPLKSISGSDESILVQQGKLLARDQKLYVNGSYSFTGSNMEVKIGIGSEFYSIIPDGIETPEVQNTPIYSKVYIRRLTGSML